MEAIPLNYEDLITSIDGADRDWEILEIPIDRVVVQSQDKKFSKKLSAYIKFIKYGKMLPPILVDEQNKLLDGEHRYEASILCGLKKIPVIRCVGSGSGRVVKDTYLKHEDGEFRLIYKHINVETSEKCIGCNKLLEHRPEGSSINIPEFPQGMPVGPYFFCRQCGLIVNPNRFIVWESNK